jgi:hypothetical protein
MKKLNKKAIGVRYLVALIIGLFVLGFILWIISRTNTENQGLLEIIKDFF